MQSRLSNRRERQSSPLALLVFRQTNINIETSACLMPSLAGRNFLLDRKEVGNFIKIVISYGRHLACSSFDH